MNEKIDTLQENNSNTLRSRAINQIKQVTSPTVFKELLREAANTYVYTRYNLNTGVAVYLYMATRGRVDSVVNTVFTREPDGQALVAETLSFTPENLAPVEAESGEMQVA